MGLVLPADLKKSQCVNGQYLIDAHYSVSDSKLNEKKSLSSLSMSYMLQEQDALFWKYILMICFYLAEKTIIFFKNVSNNSVSLARRNLTLRIYLNLKSKKNSVLQATMFYIVTQHVTARHVTARHELESPRPLVMNLGVETMES